MGQFEINLASPDDDAALRTLLASTPTEGSVRVAFTREPSYFDAAVVDGHFRQVVVVRCTATQQVVGMGVRSVFAAYVDGQPANVGYLSGLRLLPAYRGQAGLLARGYRFLRQLHDDRRAPYYLTTVAADNHAATRILSSQRAGLPVYHPWGRYHTLTYAARPASGRAPGQITVRAATPGDGPAVAAWLARQGARRQFFPVLGEEEFNGHPRRMHQLRPESILLAYEADRLVGVIGVWDQRPFKQTIVAGYSRWLQLARPCYNVAARLGAKPALPPVGQTLNVVYAAFLTAEEDRPEVAVALLHGAQAEAHAQGGNLLLVGLHESDPLLPALQSRSGREYVTILYLVYWPGDALDFDRLAARPPYLELGCL